MRALMTLALAAVLVTALGGVAGARQRICEPTDGGDAMTPAPADEAPPPPTDRRQCRPGVTDDDGCWPDDRAPLPGPRVPLSFEGGFLLGATAAPLVPGLTRQPRANESNAELAAGYLPRVERPPRAS